MEVVDTWTGRHAIALKSALRFTNEVFAEQLGTAVRTVAKWAAEPGLVPTVELQRALDTVLSRAPDDAKARFSLVLSANHIPAAAAKPVEAAAGAQNPQLLDDAGTAEVLDWIDSAASWPSGEAERRTVVHLAHLQPRQIRERAQRRGRVGRAALAQAVAQLYPGESSHAPYRVQCDGHAIATSILTRTEWLDQRASLNQASGGVRLTLDTASLPIELDDQAADAATGRMAEIIATKTRFFNSPLYRLLNVDATDQALSGTLGLTDFVNYALTVDLLESELIDALAVGEDLGSASLQLRSRYLATTTDATTPVGRLCAGGALALFAAARPGGRTREHRDYVLLVQERSGRVLNAARRLAVIPKAFHQPLVDYSDDTHLAVTLERELEEELLGRVELEPLSGQHRHADPMHITRLSEPMRWLVDRPDPAVWQMECTGFGINLISGNYEFASLIVIHDEEWWATFGGRIETNWEATGIRRYSSRDRDIVAGLVQDASWSNEGLFAFLQGIRRLAEVGGDRVDLPTVTLEM